MESSAENQPLSPSISSSDPETPIEISTTSQGNGTVAAQTSNANETSEAENGRVFNGSNESESVSAAETTNSGGFETEIAENELQLYCQRITLKPRKVPNDLAKTLQLGVKENTKLAVVEKWISQTFTEKLAGQERSLVSVTLAPLSWYGYGKKILIGDGKTMLSAAKPMSMVCPAEALDLSMTVGEYREANNIASGGIVELAFDLVVA